MLKNINVIVPVFNEAAGLPIFLKTLAQICQEIEARYPLSMRFLFVDDGSTDNTFELLKGFDFGTREVKILRLSRNFGKEAAISAGIDSVGDCDGAILMDSDMQHPPEMLLEIIERWHETGANSVYVYKENRKISEGYAKNALTRVFYWLLNKGARFNVRENAGDFRFIDRDFISALQKLPESERFMKGLYGWVGFKQIGIPFTPQKRAHGLSKFGGMRLFLLTLDALTSFTIMPLRIMACLGFLIALISSLYGVYIIIERILFPSFPPGLSSVLTLIAFFGGMQMIFLGIVGEYVGKAVVEAKKRPAYLLAEEVLLNEDQHDSDR